MVKVTLWKKIIIDKKKNTIISNVKIKDVSDKKIRNLEKNLGDIVNSPAFKNDIKGGVIMWRLKKWEKIDYKTKTFITDKNDKVLKFDYKWKDFESSNAILKNVTVSFRGKPSIDDIRWITNLIMNK